MTTMTSDSVGAHEADRPSGGFLGLSAVTWAKIGVVAGLFAAVFWSNLRRLWLKTNPISGEANWGHAVFVPLVGLFYLYVHREELWAADGRGLVWGKFTRPGRLVAGLVMVVAGAIGSYGLKLIPGEVALFASILCTGAAALGVLVVLLDWGFAVTIFGLAVFMYGIHPGKNDYVKDLGMVATLFGVGLLMGGTGVMKVAWFPVLFLVCALPWPGLMYSKVAEPLSLLASETAVQVLHLFNVQAITNGTKIVIAGGPGKPPRVLNVAEACAGIRSLMTFVSLAAVIAFFSRRALWQRLIMVASAVPIAIACNVMRISGQGLLDHFVDTRLTEGAAHEYVGLIMLVPAVFLILLVGWLLDKLVVEEDDEVVSTKPDVVTVNKPKPAIVNIPAPAVKAVPAAAKPAAPAVVARPTVTAKAIETPAAAPAAAARPTGVVPPVQRPKTAIPPTARPAAIVPPRPAAIPRPAGTVPPVARPAGAVPPRPAGIVPPRPIQSQALAPKAAAPKAVPAATNPVGPAVRPARPSVTPVRPPVTKSIDGLAPAAPANTNQETP